MPAAMAWVGIAQKRASAETKGHKKAKLEISRGREYITISQTHRFDRRNFLSQKTEIILNRKGKISDRGTVVGIRGEELSDGRTDSANSHHRPSICGVLQGSCLNRNNRQARWNVE
jgi:hypothetical protein